ncbi:MAG: TrkA family potassium uptake protein [Proteobacteria bacterium]|nr:TrkA family potassium uptake protein [Pseudomonadota bacterium]MBU1389295.1 TrkA family potassium uptake protein [Pseudomonadota bacterium]MBU1544115.1 TrkA family potassium uptake protein [Pseudomonadota bacterium]MBU2481625.1 TrkA family potassium uptake protein [Pseudomonadota bacterium]
MKQFLVIGLGNFGYHLAIRLYEKGHDVLALDKNSDLVQNIKDHVTQAIVADATDPKTISSLDLKDIDSAIVSIGSNLSNSILAVLNLQESGIRHIVAKAINDPHMRILEKLGVQEISFPEKDIAISTAERLHNPNLIDFLPFMEGYGIIELTVPDRFIGKSLREINLTNRYGVQIVAIKEMVPEKLHFIPKADFVLKNSDILILFGSDKGLGKMKTD